MKKHKQKVYWLLGPSWTEKLEEREELQYQMQKRNYKD